MICDDEKRNDILSMIELHLRDISKSLQVMSGRGMEQISEKPPKTGYAASYFARSEDEE